MNARRSQEPIFVVQHHWATADHYDFRLEIDGTLASWAVPKGPSTDPQQRRLAKRVDDHDLAHADVEGAFGYGVVQIWDRGTFRNVSSDEHGEVSAGAALERGHLSFVLAGQKISGGYSLIRTRGENMWLLIKKKDADADARRNPTATQVESVLTGRTMEQIAEDG